MLVLQDVCKSYVMAEASGKLQVLNNVSFHLKRGEFVSIVGPSGSGKSTLLNICGLLERSDKGSLFVEGMDCSTANERRRTEVRRDFFGFIYQFHHLLPECSVWENLEIIQSIGGSINKETKRYLDEILVHLNLTDKKHSFPRELSGGQQERVAIARALCHHPKIILADEPTGNLDHHNAQTVFEIFRKICKDDNVSVLMVTHNLELAQKTDVAYELINGTLRQIC